tara:strand:- start:2449 stop:4212 length:1764 start_codon:yes stop_codon:yes gene_type:complete
MKTIIHDSTLRDGNHAAKHKLSIGVIKNHCLFADKAGIHSVEIGHGNGLGASSFQVGICPHSDKDIITVAKKALTNTKLAVHVMPGFATFERDIKPAIDLGVDIFRVGTHCTEANLSISFIEKLINYDVQVLSCLMMSHMASPKELLEQAKFLESIGTHGICIYDSAGTFDLDRTEEIISTLTANLSIPVGFHGHNNLGLAVANSYIACKSGASIIDASICSYGAGAGNTQFEVLASYLDSKGYEIGVNLANLYDLVTYGSSTYAKEKPYTSTLSIVSGISGVFSGFANHVLKASALYNVNSLDLFRNLGKQRIVGGQEDQIYSVASSMSESKIINFDKEVIPKFIELNCIKKRSLPRIITKDQFEARSKHSYLTKLNITPNNSKDPVLSTLLENVKSQGRMYFDGPRTFGYGGYNSSKDYWLNITDEFIKKFNLVSSNSIIDVGCAKGYLVEEFTKKGFENCYGIDISDYAIQKTPSKIKEKVIKASVLHIPFPSKYFDFAICIDLLQELSEEMIPAAIREIQRVSKDSLIVMPALKDSSKSSKEEFLAWSITALTAKTINQWKKVLVESNYKNYFSTFNINLEFN